MMDEKKMFERYEYFLRLRGLSLTKERREIFRMIGNMSRTFSVDDLYFALHSAGLKPSKATVYRTVQVLTEGRFLREAGMLGRQMTYEATEPWQNQGVLLCEHCGRSLEFKGTVLEKFIHEVSGIHQFLPLSATVKLSGFCNECVKANPPSLRKEVCVPMLKYTQARES